MPASSIIDSLRPIDPRLNGNLAPQKRWVVTRHGLFAIERRLMDARCRRGAWPRTPEVRGVPSHCAGRDPPCAPRQHFDAVPDALKRLVQGCQRIRLAITLVGPQKIGC